MNKAERYKLISIEPTDAPEEQDGENWFRYTIGQGDNRIYGYRQGSLRTITKSVEELVVVLNDRRGGTRGRTHLRI